MGTSLEKIKSAFSEDGFILAGDPVKYRERIGCLAEHRSARNKATHEPKRVLYVEGTGYEMGYLTGLLAERQVSRMAKEFVDKIILDFIDPSLDPISACFLYQLLMNVIEDWCHFVYRIHKSDIPKPLWDELRGLLAGCKASNPRTEVTMKRLVALNFGIDCLVSAIYTGINLAELTERAISRDRSVNSLMIRAANLLKPGCFRIPLACNAFAAYGDATVGNNFYFGRDFQFATAGVYQDTACLIIHNPDYTFLGNKALPVVSQTAPGFVGSMTAMNSCGVALGVDMAPAGNCNPLRPGLNSLPMVRYAAHFGNSAEAVVSLMGNTQRGATWIYPVGDGGENRAVIVEAGMTVENLDYLSYPPDDLKPLLPKGPLGKSLRGLFARWDNWKFPGEFLAYNPGLFQKMNQQYVPEKFGERGQINDNWKTGVDSACFFVPQRESKDDLVIATNQFVTPEMRLCSMKEWTNMVTQSHIPDIIWRYDLLNKLCLEAYGTIDHDKAIKLIDFLSPNGDYPNYYGSDEVIRGSVTLCNLTKKIMTSHFGYHSDEWVSVSLSNYV